MIIQVYAFTDINHALQAVEMGVDQIGFIAGRYGLVHGELSFAEARQMARSLPAHARSVALTMSTDIEEILRMVEAVEPGILHISTDPELVGMTKMEQLRKLLPEETQLMKAIPVLSEVSIAIAQEFAPLCDYILLDTKVSNLPGVGATGMTHDWQISRRIVQTVEVPVILAGGLTPKNVAEAIMAVNPAGVDSNTGTNLAGSPVVKGMHKISEFVKAVRRIAGPGRVRSKDRSVGGERTFGNG